MKNPSKLNGFYTYQAPWGNYCCRCIEKFSAGQAGYRADRSSQCANHYCGVHQQAHFLCEKCYQEVLAEVKGEKDD